MSGRPDKIILDGFSDEQEAAFDKLLGENVGVPTGDGIAEECPDCGGATGIGTDQDPGAYHCAKCGAAWRMKVL